MQQAYERVVRQLLDQGTTTASYYATIHPHASYILAKEVDRQGQRAYVGKVNSDMLPMAEQNESVEKSLEGTREFIHLVQSLNSPTVSPIISPRFGMGCSWELMEKLGDLAREYNLPVQTHLDENPDEIKGVAERFPNTTSYTDLYKQVYYMFAPACSILLCGACKFSPLRSGRDLVSTPLCVLLIIALLRQKAN